MKKGPGARYLFTLNDYLEATASVYDNLYPPTSGLAKFVYANLRRFSGKSIVELGSRSGETPIRIGAYDYDGYEESDSLRRLAQKKAPPFPRRVDFHRDSPGASEVFRPYYEVALSLFGAPSYYPPGSILRTVSRALRPGGSFFLMFLGYGSESPNSIPVTSFLYEKKDLLLPPPSLVIDRIYGLGSPMSRALGYRRVSLEADRLVSGPGDLTSFEFIILEGRKIPY